jgi:acylphosphatase
VHGVGFRDFVVRRARALGLAGYVRNEMLDRTVEVVAEGPRDDLDRLVEDLHAGPGGARVDRVEVEWSEPTGSFTGFILRR